MEVNNHIYLPHAWNPPRWVLHCIFRMLSTLLPYSWAILKSEFTSSCLMPGTLNDEFYIVFFVCWAHFTYTLEQYWSQNSHLVALCPEPSTMSSILYFSYVEHTSPILLGNSGSQNSHLVTSCPEASTMSSILYFSYVEHTSPILLGNSGSQNSHLVTSCPEASTMSSILYFSYVEHTSPTLLSNTEVKIHI